MIKFSIQKSVESLCLTKTQLSTYAIKTEEIRNSRPLIYVDEDFNSANAVAITLPFEPYLENWLSISKQNNDDDMVDQQNKDLPPKRDINKN